MTLFASLVPLLVVAVVVALVLLVQLTPASLAASVERLARRVNLALDDDVRDEVVAFQRRRIVASALGALAVSGMVLVLVPTESSLRSGAIVLGVFGGVAMGVAVAALLHARRARRDTERGAEHGASSPTRPTTGRLTPVELVDLVPPGERRGMPIALGVAAGLVLVMVLAMVVIGSPDQLDPVVLAGSVGLLLLAAVSTAAWWAIGGRIARSRPIGGGTQALAWSDALRSVTLRDMVALPLTAAIYSPLLLLSHLLTAAEPPVSTIAGAAMGLLALAAVAGAIVAAVVFEAGPPERRPSRHYQRRLWPELVEGGAR